jgi:predicted Fe-S protein YdhL (DUF1289 family)
MHEPSGHCIGCGRTLDEIALWSVLDDDDKRAVWAVLPARMAALPSDTPPPLLRPPGPSSPSPADR